MKIDRPGKPEQQNLCGRSYIDWLAPENANRHQKSDAYHSGGDAPLALWCFDLLSIDGTRLMPLRLDQRKERLAELVAVADHERLQFSGGFSDAAKLMAACERLGHEGIVSKRRDGAYRPGRSPEWQKAKTASRRRSNADRFALIKG